MKAAERSRFSRAGSGIQGILLELRAGRQSRSCCEEDLLFMPFIFCDFARMFHILQSDVFIDRYRYGYARIYIKNICYTRNPYTNSVVKIPLFSGQLSRASRTPSWSQSFSQMSPTPSPSVSSWSGSWTRGHLSTPLRTPSPSASSSHASPAASPSQLSWSALATFGQLSKSS